MAPQGPPAGAVPLELDPVTLLPTLKRFDPEIEEVLGSSGHVSLYTMAVEQQQWQRKNVEGSLFLLKRRTNPRFQMMVLNKLATENYVEDIHPGLDFELNPPYLMYTHGNHEIIGVWFFIEQDLHRIEGVLQRIKHSYAAPMGHGAGPAHGGGHAQAPPPAAAPPEPQAGGDDDSAFYDKPKPGGGQPRALVPAAGEPAPAAAATAPGNNLANLFHKATLKQQQQQAGSDAHHAPQQPPAGPPPGAPALLPPSFFAPQQPRPQPVPPQAPPPQLPQQQVPASPGSRMPPPQLPAPQAPAAPPAQMPGTLAKLFANAHKAPGAPPAGAPPGPQPAAPQAVHAASAPPGHGVQQAVAPPAASNGVSDEEKVRRLLGRIATNEALLRMLAGEMRAVGLL